MLSDTGRNFGARHLLLTLELEAPGGFARVGKLQRLCQGLPLGSRFLLVSPCGARVLGWARVSASLSTRECSQKGMGVLPKGQICSFSLGSEHSSVATLAWSHQLGSELSCAMGEMWNRMCPEGRAWDRGRESWWWRLGRVWGAKQG